MELKGRKGRTIAWLLFIALGCGTPAPDADCEKAKAKAQSCMTRLPPGAECPNEGEADALQECIYRCYSEVKDCAEYSDSTSVHVRCLQGCVDDHGVDPP